MTIKPTPPIDIRLDSAHLQWRRSQEIPCSAKTQLRQDRCDATGPLSVFAGDSSGKETFSLQANQMLISESPDVINTVDRERKSSSQGEAAGWFGVLSRSTHVVVKARLTKIIIQPSFSEWRSLSKLPRTVSRTLKPPKSQSFECRPQWLTVPL